MELIRFSRIFGVLVLLIASMNIGCKEDETVMEEPPVIDESEVTAQGAFISAVHATSGTVKVESNGTTASLNFEDFKTDNGPDLRVYLSTDKTIASAIEVGDLKSTAGDFSYNIDANTDLVTYPNVLIWCEDFSVLFGSAVLSEP